MDYARIIFLMPGNFVSGAAFYVLLQSALEVFLLGLECCMFSPTSINPHIFNDTLEGLGYNLH